MARPSFDLASRESLSHSLGFMPNSRTAMPYLDYIVAQAPDRTRVNDWLRLFKDVVDHFTYADSGNDQNPRIIREFIGTLVEAATHFYFSDTTASSPNRDIVVTDSILHILGVWTLMKSYFVPLRGRHRHIIWTFCVRKGEPISEALALARTVSSLLIGSGLLPSSEDREFQARRDGFASETIEVLLEPIMGPRRWADENWRTALRTFATTYTSVSSPIGEPTSSNSNSHSQLHSSLDSIESLSIHSKELNAFKLSTLAGVRIHWTTNISRHLLLSNHAQRYYLEVFALPCAFEDGDNHNGAFRSIGISSELIYEIRDSYSALFNPRPPTALHRLLSKLVGLRLWCWCLSCSSRRLMNREMKKLKSKSGIEDRLGEAMNPNYDPVLERWVEKEPPRWDQSRFPNLWSRIVVLETHLRNAKPWRFWVIFRDRRDSVQFWTFLFGTIILVLTFVQVFLGALQVAGSS